jgi:C-terminal processing protease CtpA/Prc
LSRQQAIEDIDYLVGNIESIHYEPFRNVTKKDFNDCAERIKSGFNEKVSRKDFSISIMEMLALLKDAHSNLGSFPDFIEYVKSKGRIFPLKFGYKDGELIVFNPADANEFRANSDVKLVEIDDKPIDSYLERYRRYVSAESDYFKDILIAARFRIYLWYFEGQRDSFKVKMEDEKDRWWTKVVYAVNIDTNIKKKKIKAKDMFTYHFYKDDSVCFFRASSFYSFNEDMTINVTVRKKLIRILENLFTEMKKRCSSMLIIDLRNNGGGDPRYGEELLKRATSRAFKKPEMYIRNSRSARKAYIINALEKNRIPAFFHFENIFDFRLYGMKKENYEVQGEYWFVKSKVVEPVTGHWNGRLVLLVNGLTGSAAAGFASIVKDNHLGFIAGKETGGAATFYGGVIPIILPNSGLICNLSNVEFIRPGGFDDGRGILPDLELDVTLDDKVLVEKIYDYIKMNGNN